MQNLWSHWITLLLHRMCQGKIRPFLTDAKVNQFTNGGGEIRSRYILTCFFQVCHKGHDCKLKRTSPTAYCDCWEKCRCKALVGGNWAARCDLLARLARDTQLATHFNSRYGHVTTQ